MKSWLILHHNLLGCHNLNFLVFPVIKTNEIEKYPLRVQILSGFQVISVKA